MFEIKDGRISLNKTKQLTPKQLTTMKSMSETERESYILSILGMSRRRCYVDRLKSGGADELASRSKGVYFAQMKRLLNIDRDHAPTSKDLGSWVGVEIECIIPHQPGDDWNSGDCECSFDEYGNIDGDECDYCCNGGNGDNWSERESHKWLRAELSKAGVSRVNVKSDGSVSDEDGHGVEVTILFNSSYGFEPLQKLCKTLTNLKCYINKTCGLHVHLDARNLKPKEASRIGHSIGHALPVIKWLVPESRHTNQYCQLGVSKLLRNSDRYYAVNLTAYPKYKTIEIRLHSGSINASKIESWVKILKVIGQAKLSSRITTFEEFMSIDGMSESLIEYADKRITELNEHAWSILIPVTPIVAPIPVTLDVAEQAMVTALQTALVPEAMNEGMAYAEIASLLEQERNQGVA